ncbi:hypothetical protein CI102_12349 [Trichoderma harzianum]|nr:hypothetical protein CI102_12349 [Trichoderma harzianum]
MYEDCTVRVRSTVCINPSSIVSSAHLIHTYYMYLDAGMPVMMTLQARTPSYAASSCTEHRRHVSARRRVSRCEMMCWAGRQTQTQTHLDGLGAQLSSRPTYSISFFPLTLTMTIQSSDGLANGVHAKRLFRESFCAHARTRGEQIPREREPCSRAGNFQ